VPSHPDFALEQTPPPKLRLSTSVTAPLKPSPRAVWYVPIIADEELATETPLENHDADCVSHVPETILPLCRGVNGAYESLFGHRFHKLDS
jgi:hypothetical protein